MLVKIKSLKLSERSPLIFFALFFLLGIMIVPTFGLGWDDEWSRSDTGFNNLKYVFYGDQTLLSNNEKYHGPFLEMLLASIEKVLHIDDVHNIFLCRHYVLFFLFFIAVISFYKICQEMFSNELSLLACIVLVLSPRIFAESFYNSKDLGFLSMMVISVFFSLRFLKQRTTASGLFSGLVAGMLIDVRILGIMIPFLVVFYFIVDLIFVKNHTTLKPLFYFIIACIASTILFWPILWEGPIFHFLNALAEMSRYHWDANVFFNAQSIHASKLPWFYIPEWLVITTPILYTILFLLGLIFFIKELIVKPWDFIKNYKWGMVLALFFAPLCLVIFLHSVVYDTWRHLYFIYPFFVIIAIFGVKFINNSFKHLLYVKKAFTVVFGIQLMSIVYWMTANHPHQNVYFNSIILAKGRAESFFELDYWGLSYKQGLEHILKYSKENDTIFYTSLNLPGKLNHYMFNSIDRKRLKYTEFSDSTWTYYLTNYRGMGAPENVELLHQIKVDDSSIMGIYKKK